MAARSLRERRGIGTSTVGQLPMAPSPLFRSACRPASSEALKTTPQAQKNGMSPFLSSILNGVLAEYWGAP